MARLAASYAEDIVELIISQPVVITIHTADPGGVGNNPATLDPVAYDNEGNWAAFVSENGNRIAFTLSPMTFAEEATEEEPLTHFTIWEQDGETFIYDGALANPQTTVPGNPVRFPAGSFGIAGGPGTAS